MLPKPTNSANDQPRRPRKVATAQREAKAAYSRDLHAELAEIGPPPAPPPGRRWAGKRLASDESLLAHLGLCYPAAFTLAWSADHLKLITRLQQAAEGGLLRAVGMPRGSGKTTIVTRAALWALLTGRRRYCAIIAATDTRAGDLLRGLKTEITHNPKLRQYYAAELHTLLHLGGEALRAKSQKSGGQLTGAEWLADRINFGYVDGMTTSGAIVTTAGLTGSIRGQQVVTPAGTIERPDLLLVDDPQTKASAGSESQCQKRHETMMGDALGLAGPGKRISGIATLTIIYQGDLAARLLDRKQSPDWNGETCRMIYAWPSSTEAENLWEQYAAIRGAELADGGTGKQATKLYRKNRAAMDAGALVAWPARKHRDELSALQHAVNLKLRDPAAFAAEYQNDPTDDGSSRPFDLNAETLARRTGPTPRGELPPDAHTLAAFVDVQKEVLFYMVTAWTPTARGSVIQYGTYPDQRRDYFTKSDIRTTMAGAANSSELASYLTAALEKLSGDLLEHKYIGADGTPIRLERMAIDANWGYSTDTVRRFCRDSPHSGRIFPSFGKYVGANHTPWHRIQWSKRERIGLHYRLQAPPAGSMGARELLVDVNFWKSLVAERLLVPAGSERAITLHAGEVHKHRMLAEHLAAEDPVLVIAKTGAKAIEWKQNPGRPNNDFFDCLVGNAVIASLNGVDFQQQTGHIAPPKRKIVTW